MRRARPSTAWTWWRCEEAATRPPKRVRAGHGPRFLEFRTYRFRAHSMFDPELYRIKDEVERLEEARIRCITFTDALQGGRTHDRGGLQRLEREVDARDRERSPSPRLGPGAGRGPHTVRVA